MLTNDDGQTAIERALASIPPEIRYRPQRERARKGEPRDAEQRSLFDVTNDPNVEPPHSR